MMFYDLYSKLIYDKYTSKRISKDKFRNYMRLIGQWDRQMDLINEYNNEEVFN